MKVHYEEVVETTQVLSLEGLGSTSRLQRFRFQRNRVDLESINQDSGSGQHRQIFSE